MKLSKRYITKAIQQAEVGLPVIPGITIPGYSSDRVRRLLNSLCQIDNANYLEIGTHQGSTLVPALWNNTVQATCIDNWSVYGVQTNALAANLEKFLPGRIVNVIEGDMFTLDLDRLIPDVNVYFYDGDHTEEGQYQAFARYYDIFADQFVAVVDDWNWEVIRNGTYRALESLSLVADAHWILETPFVNDKDTWWNGLLVALIRKTNAN